MKLDGFKRIITEDFDSKDKTLVSKIAFSVNSFADNVSQALNNNLTIEDNLNMFKKDLAVTVDATGKPTITCNVKSTLLAASSGITVIQATNTMNASIALPTGTPFITYTENSGIITITNITNLPANVSFSLRLLIIG